MIKKLIALFSLVTLLFIQSPPMLTVYGVLTPPTAWDYAYKYNATADEFQFTNYAGTSTDTPVYTRTTDGDYYNYTYTGSGNDTLPFDVTLTFNRSNTSWKALGGGYTSDDTKIGSDGTVGTPTTKYYYNFMNNTNHDYYLIIDISSSQVDGSWVVSQDSLTLKTYSNYLYASVVSLKFLIIPAFTIISISRYITSTSTYLDAVYLQDLGVSESYTAGVNSVPYKDINLDGFDDNSFLAGINRYTDDSIIKPLLYSPLNYTFMIGLFIYLSLLFVAFVFKNRITFAIAGLFFFVPLTIFISDIWISLLSVIAIILHMTFAFFHDKKEDETI